MPFTVLKRFAVRFPISLIIVLVAWSGGAAVQADEPISNPIAGEQQWQMLAEKLSLDKSQRDKLDDIARDYHREAERLDSIGDDLRQRIHNIDYGALDLGEILGISSEMGRITSQKTEAMLRAQKALVDMLEPEQKARLIELRSEQRPAREQFLRGMMASPEEQQPSTPGQ